MTKRKQVKPSIENRARKAAETQRKGKAAAAVKASVKQGLDEMMNKANTDIDNGNVVTLKPAGTPKAEPKAENNFDLAVKLSAPVDERTSGNKPSERAIVPTDDQRLTVNQLVNSTDKDWLGSLSSLKTKVAEAQWLVHCYCVAFAVRIQKNPDTVLVKGVDDKTVLDTFLDAVGGLSGRYTMVRKEAVVAWLLNFSALSRDDEGRFQIDRKRHRHFGGKFGNKPDEWTNERLARPFFMFKPAPALGEFSFLAKIAEAIKAAERIAKMDSDALHARYKVADLQGLEELKKAFGLIENKLHKQEEIEEEKAA